MIAWTVVCQASLSMEFSGKEYWSGSPFPSAGDLPKAGTEPGTPALQADSLPSEPPGNPLYRKHCILILDVFLYFFFPKERFYYEFRSLKFD